MNIFDLKRQYQPKQAVVLGCGPSSTELTDFGDAALIGVNEICSVIALDILVLQNYDYQYPSEIWDKILDAEPRYIVSPFMIEGIGNRKNFIKAVPGNKGGLGLGKDGRLDYSDTSAYMAVCLAAYLGAIEIGILGVDLTSGRFSGGTNWHPLQTQARRINYEFAALSDELKKVGKKLFNLSSISKLAAIPYKSPQQFVLSGASL